MLFQKHKFKFMGERSITISLYSNYSPDMTYGLVEDAMRGSTKKDGESIADFIHNHHAKEGENRRVYSEKQWFDHFRGKAEKAS